MKHNWSGPFECPEAGADAPERRKHLCARCGVFVVCAAYGKLPTRRDVGVIQPREITGWQTPEQALSKMGISEDCDLALTQIVMES